MYARDAGLAAPHPPQPRAADAGGRGGQLRGAVSRRALVSDAVRAPQGGLVLVTSASQDRVDFPF